MADLEDHVLPLPPNTHYEAPPAPSSQATPPITQHSESPGFAVASLSSSSSHSDVKKVGNNISHFAPIKGAGNVDDNGLERTLSQMYGPLDEDDRAAMQRIASLHNTKSTTATTNDLQRNDTLAGMADDDPRLDPEKPEFDIYIWARAFMRAADEHGIKRKRAGFVFKNLGVSGSGSAVSLQKDVVSILMAPFRLNEFISLGHKPHKQIIRNFDGIVKSGEMLVVLGRPGSGCSTFLKTICGELTGLDLDRSSTIHYNGIPQHQMMKEFLGEVAYNQEVDKHFPHLTVGETLEFAAAARTPQSRVRGISRTAMIEHMTKVVMTVFGLSHTRNTKVGNEYIRGVSGGERKRVSIAEMALAGSPIGCWDNSTRGLDAATALEFTRSLRVASNIGGMCNAVAIYQASQAIFDIFDKAVVLYEGRQIYFGPTNTARQYFEQMGWYCPPRQTTGDFLTSVTNPQERKARKGCERQVPRTVDEFEAYWKQSSEHAAVVEEIRQHETGIGDNDLADMREAHRATQARHVRPKSPYVISIWMQIRLCTVRAYQRLWNDKVSTVTTVIGQIIMALIVGSVFYGTPDSTGSFYSKGATLFFAILLNALISITEINNLYDQRPIVEKHASYAFYHPWTEAMAGIVSDIPVKFVIAVCFNIILYFLAGLRTEPSQFFIFFLFVFVSMLTMSSIFRSLAALTKTLSQAMAFAGVMVLAIVIYTGFTLPRPYEHPWMKWISWINPVAYAFEAIMVNEVHGREFPCSSFVPTPEYQVGSSFICSVAGAVAGETTVSGDSWVQSSYQYSYSHIWRNLGFIFAFQIFFLVVYLVATELNSSTSSSAEVLVFRRGHVPKFTPETADRQQDEESGANEKLSSQNNPNDTSRESSTDKINAILPQKDIFTWRNVTYDIAIKGEPRRLLDNVSGWVKPGTLTALMGVSGAGKTTLLDALAQRTSTGVITGDMLVNGKSLDSSFQRSTGYVQQQDLHLETTTVREALRFSAMLRQPKSVSKTEKYEFVEQVIQMLSMQDFAEAIVGVPGEGLNVEQRKLLTIGVELAAKPALLLFLDEPTSGLDSQSSWAIVAFLRKLADNGQAVLSTIHQPSSILFQEFDRLLFLAKGGKTVYFGDIGDNSETLLNYFEAHGARHCGEEENPAEFMLEIVGAGASGKSTQDWHEVWKRSDECRGIQTELDRIHREKINEPATGGGENHQEFAMPFSIQLSEVTLRVFSQYYRTPSYIWGKMMLGVMSALFIGFSFYKQNSSQQGLQNIIFSVFMLTSIFSTLVQQIMPRFVSQRSLYEVRERPSKAYSWAAFVIANIFVEIPWQILLGVIVYASYYFPIFGQHQSSERMGLILLFCVQFFVFASTFAQMLIAALPDAETAGNIATLMFSLTLTFNGVMQPPQALPGFWLFMYRVSPLTYLVDGIAATGMHDRAVECATNEYSRFAPPSGQTCGQYLAPYLASTAGSVGSLVNPASTVECQYCPLSNSDQFLGQVAISWHLRWRNYGIGFAYILFNIFAAITLYYVFRVRHWSPASIAKGPSLLVHWIGRGGKYLRVGIVGHGKEIPKEGTKEMERTKSHVVY